MENNNHPHRENPGEKSPIADIVRTHVKARPKIPNDLRQRCREATAISIDVLKLGRAHEDTKEYYPQGSLIEYIEALSQTAGAKLVPLFRFMKIDSKRPYTSESATGLGALASQMGIPLRDAMLRTRWGIARTLDAVSANKWPTTSIARARSLPETEASLKDINHSLENCEANYPESRLNELNHALDGITSGYEENTV